MLKGMVVLFALAGQMQLADRIQPVLMDNSASSCMELSEKIGVTVHSVCDRSSYRSDLCTRLRRNAYDARRWCDSSANTCYERMKKALGNPRSLPRGGFMEFEFNLGFDQRNPVWGVECKY